MIDLCPAALVTEAMTRMLQCRASCVLVVEQQHLVGIFSERDVVKITAGQMKLEDVAIAQVMIPALITFNVSQEQGIFWVLYDNILQIFQIQAGQVTYNENSFDLYPLPPTQPDSTQTPYTKPLSRRI